MKTHRVAEAFHNLIKALKNSEKFGDIRFVRRFGTVPAENPVMGYLAACSLSKLESAPCFLGADTPSDIYLYTLTGAIDFYCPFHTKPSEFEEKTALLTEGILEADTTSQVRKIEVSDVDFNSDLQSLTRKIKVKMEVYAAGEVDEL